VRSVWQHLHESLGQWDGAADRHQRAYLAGEISYEEFCARDAAHWKGRRIEELKAIADGIPYRGRARDAVDRLKASGTVLGVVSTGLTILSDRAHQELGLAFSMANRLLAEEGVVTGGVEVNVRHGHKGEAVETFCRRFDLDPRRVISVGDSEGDISMFERTGFSVAFNPSGALTAGAASCVHEGDSLLDLVMRLPLGG
jgi:phosphoserine phosphatase